MKNKKRSRQLE